ncbi:MAG TPA: 50S ribosomal protein L23 [Candidatus Limnocylindria bacterium]|jgi:large subunit ribosomal protein L23|nr:50S ribosomal protein L23 [Candidatus Limnocylindria bacterium]
MSVRGSAILIRPVITERSMSETNTGRYTFAVAKDATKRDIADAVAGSFKVDVIAVNVIHVPGKTRRLGRRTGHKPDWKKAIVTLAEGQRIEKYFVEGV